MRADVLGRSWPFGFRWRFMEDLLVEEVFRTNPPGRRDIDLGELEQRVDHARAHPEESGHLTRRDLPMVGRLLRIDWLDGDDAQAVHDTCFRE